jgi:RHS repeat-associated protein
VARDAYSYALYYYASDYTPIGGTNPFDTAPTSLTSFSGLYNGNIAAMSTNIKQLTDPWHYYTYTYDQLNRIRANSVYKVTSPTVNTPVTDYHETFTYDGNGNIQNVLRNMNSGVAMDKLNYQYNLSAGRLVNNRLNFITDSVTTHTYPYGLDNQNINNYTYDAIGNMTADLVDTVSNINYTVYGKIQTLTNSKGILTYTYDAAGQRVTKNLSGITTYYIRDAQGNTLALYDNTHSVVNWKEQDLYGSDRLGMWQPNIVLGIGSGITAWDTIGKKQLELTNHLGNVWVTISDKRIQHSTNGTTVDYFNADIATAQEYYAFGGLMPNRTYTYLKNYRYGFNGQEKSDEIAGNGNHNTAEFWEYDTRLGRRWNLDPRSNVSISSYSAFSNNPIAFSDPLGDTVKVYGNAEVTHTTLIDKGAVKDVAGGAIHYKGVTLVPELNSGNKLIGYNVYDDSNTDRNMPVLQLEPGDLEGFKSNFSNYIADARMYYMAGEPSQAMKEVSAGLAIQNYSYAAGGVKKEWKGALHNPVWWAGALLATANLGVNLFEPVAPVPPEAIDVRDYAASKNGAVRPGYVGGRQFANDGRGGGQILPTSDANNSSIIYREYDIYPKVKGQNRGTDRVVIGSNGRSYYTNDHYQTFKEIK